MVHKLIEELYREAHLRKYAVEMKVEGLNDDEFIVSVLMNLFRLDSKEPVLSIDLRVGDTSSDPDKFECGIAVKSIRSLIEDDSYILMNELFGTLNWIKTVIKNTTEDSDVWEPEKILAENMAIITSIAVSDMSGLMGIDNDEDSIKDVFPIMEYNIVIGTKGNVSYLYDPEAVVNKSPKVIRCDYDGVVLQEIFKLIGIDINTETTLKADDKIEKLLARIVATCLNPTYDSIYKSYASLIVRPQ